MSSSIEVSTDSLKAGLGVDRDVESITYRELRERRELIQRRMRDHLGK